MTFPSPDSVTVRAASSLSSSRRGPRRLLRSYQLASRSPGFDLSHRPALGVEHAVDHRQEHQQSARSAWSTQRRENVVVAEANPHQLVGADVSFSLTTGTAPSSSRPLIVLRTLRKRVRSSTSSRVSRSATASSAAQRRGPHFHQPALSDRRDRLKAAKVGRAPGEVQLAQPAPMAPEETRSADAPPRRAATCSAIVATNVASSRPSLSSALRAKLHRQCEDCR